MRKYKNGAILMLTAVIIVLCAMLPVITAQVQDSLADENVSYEEMKTVQFFEEISVTEKLFLLARGNVAEASEEKTKISAENIREVAEQALFPYVEAGMIQGDLSAFSIYYEPILYYNSESPDISCIFWIINMDYTDSMSQNIYLCIDDQTGKIMVISYECSEEIYDESILHELLSWFYAHYHDELDFWNQEMNGFISEETDSEALSEKFGIDGNVSSTDSAVEELTFHYEDEINGELGIAFCVYPNGFYNAST